MKEQEKEEEEEDDENNGDNEDGGDRGISATPLRMSSNLFHSWLVVVVGILCFHLYFHWGFLWCLSTTHDHRSVGRKIAAEGKSW